MEMCSVIDPRRFRLYSSLIVSTGIVCQSPPFLDSFMTMVLSYKPSVNMTSGFLGFHTGSGYPAVGIRLIRTFKEVATQVAHPLLLPVLVYGLWTDHLNHEHISVAARLRSIQRQTGLMNDYLRLKMTVEDLVNFDGVHRD